MTQTSSTPLITVITVVYNGAKLLDKTIQSVITQRYAPIEYIVIDGASTDGSTDIIKKHELKITKWLSEKDTGIYNAMNKGIKKATGKWICFLNCGDVFTDNESVGKVAEAIALDNGGTTVIYGNILILQVDGTYKEKIAKEPCNLHRMFFCHQSAFVKTDVLRQFLFDERYKMSADLKFFKQCYYEKHLFKHLNYPLVIYDKSGISNTSRRKGLRENIAVVKEMDSGFEKILFLLRLYFVIYWRNFLGKP
ncbi:MAG: glycosyltransferase [Prevotellaceae bacterium]|jgi:glycosyltransferase involved in cell wall biosynthesis|nr:glycosyltransferase [Prevotellaceae bacterium]